MKAPFLQYPMNAVLSSDRRVLLHALASHIRERLGNRYRFVTGYSKF